MTHPTKILLWNEELVPPALNTFSPSWRKPGLFVKRVRPHLEEWGIAFQQSEPLSIAELMTVHDPVYVVDVIDGKTSNGFGSRDPLTAQSFLYTSGAMAQGVSLALDCGASVCAPVSGFHHAGYNHGGGFCTFNGLAVAAKRALDKRKLPGIIDIDAHYGNGTDNIMRVMGWEFPHYTFGGINYAKMGSKRGMTEGEMFLNQLPLILQMQFTRCDVLLYQAGADPHVNDPLGGSLTTMEMMERDQIVFDFAKKRGIPVVWNLAGGYQEPVSKVLDLHLNTIRIWAAT